MFGVRGSRFGGGALPDGSSDRSTLAPRMDLRYTPEEDAFRAEARAWLEANVPRRAAAELRHRGRLRAAPRVGAQALGGPLVGGVVAGGVRRSRRRLPPLADLRGGVLPGRGAGPGEPERHLPPRAHDHGGRHRRAEGAVPPHHGVERDRLGAGLERAQRRLRPRRHPLDRRAQRRRRASGSSTGRRSGRHRAVWADWCFGIFRTDPGRRTPPRPHLRARAARLAGRHRAPDRAARRRHRFRRDLLRRRARARWRTRWAR